MSMDAPRIVVVGGHSRIGTALVPLLGRDAAYVGRQPMDCSQAVVVADYGDIPPSTFRDVHCVINCVGASAGAEGHLDRLNVDMPLRLAKTARSAGVAHLINISSFSVYGGASVIDSRTRPAPTSDYGRSKLAADTALLAIADDRFSVTIIRLPLIYGVNSFGKLGRLLRLWERVRLLPVPSPDVSRAMIGVELSAEVIARLTLEPHTGVVFAADPEPFSYAAVARARGRLHRLKTPRFVTRLIGRITPAIGDRLFSDSRLAVDDNLAIRYGLASRLYRDIAAAPSFH